MATSSFSVMSDEPIIETDYSSMTITELKAKAKNMGLTGYTSLNKADLIQLLELQ